MQDCILMLHAYEMIDRLIYVAIFAAGYSVSSLIHESLYEYRHNNHYRDEDNI